MPKFEPLERKQKALPGLGRGRMQSALIHETQPHWFHIAPRVATDHELILGTSRKRLELVKFERLSSEPLARQIYRVLLSIPNALCCSSIRTLRISCPAVLIGRETSVS